MWHELFKLLVLQGFPLRADGVGGNVLVGHNLLELDKQRWRKAQKLFGHE